MRNGNWKKRIKQIILNVFSKLGEIRGYEMGFGKTTLGEAGKIKARLIKTVLGKTGIGKT